MMEANLRPLLPLGTITRIPPQHNSSQLPIAIDFIWGNENAEDIFMNFVTEVSGTGCGDSNLIGFSVAS